MIRIGLVVVLAVAAAVAANFVLLGVATGPKDPVGRLSPNAGIVVVPVTGGVGSTTPGANAPAAGNDRPRSDESNPDD